MGSPAAALNPIIAVVAKAIPLTALLKTGGKSSANFLKALIPSSEKLFIRFLQAVIVSLNPFMVEPIPLIIFSTSSVLQLSLKLFHAFYI